VEKRLSILIVAEAGINHGGDMSVARELIIRAKDAGADIWKTQVYDVPNLFPTGEILVNGRNWYPEVLKTQLSKEQVQQLAVWCQEAEIEFMASAFDCYRIGWLEEVGVKRHKLATRATLMPDLVDAVVATGKPVIVSLGNKKGWKPNPFDAQFTCLHCIPEYPTPFEHFRLHDVVFGFRYHGISVHSPSPTPAMAAIARGARVVEVHFTLSRQMVGPDHSSSLEPGELKSLVRYAGETETVLGIPEPMPYVYSNWKQPDEKHPWE